MSNSMMSNPLTPWLILHLIPQFGAVHWRTCLQQFASPAEFCEHSKANLIRLGCSELIAMGIRKPDWSVIGEALRWLEQPDHHILTLHDPRYPLLLREITCPPPILYVHGNPEVLSRIQLAIVGARKASFNAQRIAHCFAKQLCEQRFAITSGLALGIDTAAHHGALTADHGLTIAVIGSGLNKLYPEKNRDLAEKIVENGAIVSEFPLLTAPHPRNFPQRNRIISGLSVGVLVVEAAQKSGSLITARYALEQNREVFAIPGSILNKMADGCHSLIQQGAKLVTSVASITEEVNTQMQPDLIKINTKRMNFSTSSCVMLDNDHCKLLECIGFDATSFEQLVSETGFPTQKVNGLLCHLKLGGYIIEEPAGFTRAMQ